MKKVRNKTLKVSWTDRYKKKYFVTDSINKINKIYIKKIILNKTNKSNDIKNKKNIYWDIINLKKEINYIKKSNKNWKIYNEKYKKLAIKINDKNIIKNISGNILELRNNIFNYESLIRKNIQILNSINVIDINNKNRIKRSLMKNKFCIIFKNLLSSLVIKNIKFNNKNYFLKNKLIYNYMKTNFNKFPILIKKKNSVLTYTNSLKDKIKILKINKISLLNNWEFNNLKIKNQKELIKIREEKYELTKSSTDIKNKIKYKENIIDETMDKINIIKISFENKIKEIKIEKKQIYNKILTIKSKSKSIADDISMDMKFKNSSVNDIYNININSNTIVSNNNYKIMKKIEFEEIENFIKKLRFKLLIKNIEINDIFSLIDNYKNDKINLQNCINILKNKPFNIKKEDVCIKISRFLIEDNYKNNIEFSYFNTNTYHIVKSILNNLFYKLEFPIQTEYDNYHNKIYSLLIKNFGKINKFKNWLNKGNIISFNELLEILKKINMGLNIKEINFLEINLYYLFNKSFLINLIELKKLINSSKENILNKNIRQKNLNKKKHKTRKFINLSRVNDVVIKNPSIIKSNRDIIKKNLINI